MAAYEAVPVEEFGLAMMRGMGWSEGVGIGRRARAVGRVLLALGCMLASAAGTQHDSPFEQDVLAPEYVRRPQGLGLGAEPAKPPAVDLKVATPCSSISASH